MVRREGELQEAPNRHFGNLGRVRPIAFSRQGWMQPPGTRTRMLRTAPYLRAFRQMVLATRPHVVHANTLLSLPEAFVAHRLGIPVVLHVHELPNRDGSAT